MILPSPRSAIIWALAAIAAFGVVYLYSSGRFATGNRWGTYDWHCTSCGYNFHAPIPADGSGQFVMDCPSCGKHTAERIVHFTCRNCGAHFDLEGLQLRTFPVHCPKCNSTNVIAP